MNTDTREVLRNGHRVPTEPQVFDVLCLLIEHHDRVVTKQELLDTVWGTEFVSEGALSSRIKDARKVLGDDGRRQEFITTVHGRGFRFIHPDLRTVGGGAGSVPPPTAASGPEVMVDAEFAFVGRSDTLVQIDALADTAADGTQLVLLGGEPGIGKTRLAVEAATRLAVERGWRAIGGRCDRHLATSLQPWIESMNPVVEALARGDFDRGLGGISEQLRPVLPAVEARLGPNRLVLEERRDDFAAIDGLAALVRWLSEQTPTVVVLDDVQWAGGATRALTSLLQRTAVPNLMIVMTFRTNLGDLDEASSDWIDSLQRSGGHRVDVEALRPDEIGELVSSSLESNASQRTKNDIWTQSEGHCLFAVELIRDVRNDVDREGLPDSVASLVRSRLTKLPQPVTALVGAGAAIGPEFDLENAAAAAGLTELEALDAVDLALGAQLVHEIDGRPDWYRFSHQLVPASALESMSSSRRIRLHAALAARFEDTGAPGAQIAHHLLEASAILDTPTVVERVRSTCRVLVLDHQYDRAAELLERTAELDLDPRVRTEVLVEYGEACNLAALQPRALQPFMRAAEISRRNGWHDLLARSALGLWGQSPFRASQDETVIPLLDEAIAASQQLDEATRARLLAKRAAFNLFTGTMAERESLTAEAAELVGTEPTLARLEVLEARWMAIASPRRMADCVDLDDELRPLRKELGALTTDACAPEISIYWRGLGEELRELAAEVSGDPRQRRDVDQWRITSLEGAFALFAGDVDTARQLADRALPLGREPWGEAGEVVHGLVHLIVDAIEGDVEPSLERWRTIAAKVPSDPMRATLAWVEAEAGDLGQARHLLDRVTPRLPLLTDNFMGGFGLVGATNAALLLEDDEVLAVLAPILEPLSGQMLGHPWAPSLAGGHLVAAVADRQGRADDHASARAAAEALYERLNAPALVTVRT